ncbi:diguanylate cyclase (GGDEF) domain-containing protein [Rhizobiales bacterium GAS188]|nr:diguanylate cyclase (GGDEF) domain-containing protein [Rhizobiales bacterium GAS188]
MRSETRIFSLPRWRVTRWLTDAGPGVPDEIRAGLIASLFGTLPVFAGGLVNTLVVSAAIAARLPTPPFIAWLVLEIAIGVARLIVLIAARRAALAGRETPTDIYLVLALCWGGSVGYGAVVSLASGDWVVATLACLSAAAMVGGICFRNFGAPRLVAAMILLSLGPCSLGAVLSGEPILLIVFVQIPLYLVAMSLAAFRLNKMLVATMRAERENDHRARHDALTGLTNRSGLIGEIETKWLTANRQDEAMALLYLDLDGFKTVNDTYGHAAGDQLLKMVADRLSRLLRSQDMAARIGGDEFVVLTQGVEHSNALELGQMLIRAIAASYDLDGSVSATVGVSVGIALAPEHGEDFATLLAAADAALYDAKSKGKSRCSVASPATSLARLRRLHCEATASTQTTADRAA